jgi:osmotically-inducible protein OsmY
MLPAASAQQGNQNQSQQQSQMQQNREKMHGSMLQNRVYNRLSRSGALAGRDVQVNARGNTVTLTGTVASEQEKQRAQRYAMQVPGVASVQNQLRIDQQAATRAAQTNVDDSQLSKQIAQKLASSQFPGAETEEDWLFGWEVEGENFEFDIDVDDGDVTLEGTIPYNADIGAILRTVREVPGVRTVESQLRMPSSGWMSDTDTPYGYGYNYDPYYWGPYWR